MEHKKPEMKFSAGPITAAIWLNISQKDGKVAEFRSVSLDRVYKDKESWKHTNNLRLHDLPRAALVLNKAYEYLVLKGATEAY